MWTMAGVGPKLSDATILVPKLPVKPVSVLVGLGAGLTTTGWRGIGWPVCAGPGQRTLMTAVPGGWPLTKPLKSWLGRIGTGSGTGARAADAAAERVTLSAAVIKPVIRAARSGRR